MNTFDPTGPASPPSAPLLQQPNVNSTSDAMRQLAALISGGSYSQPQSTPMPTGMGNLMTMMKPDAGAGAGAGAGNMYPGAASSAGVTGGDFMYGGGGAASTFPLAEGTGAAAGGDSSLAGAGAGGAGGSGAFGGLGSLGLPMLYAALIGTGKNIESKNPNSGLGQGLLAGLAPSGKQIAKDPVGMGLPTLFGMPFLTPLTSSKEAQAAKPEWQSLFPLGSKW